MEKVIWSRTAEERLRENITYYAEQNPTAAWRIYVEVLERAEILAPHPEIGRKGRVKETREFVLTGTPFILIYHVINNQVEILNVLHGAQRWPN